MTNHRDDRSTVRFRPARSAVVLRSLIVLSPLLAVGTTWLAAGRNLPAVAVLVALLSGACAVRPNSHIGVLVVATVAIEWLTSVHQHTSLWSIGTAAALTVFHTALAAATVAPTTAPWTRAMRLRWTRRAAVLIVACAAVWVVVAIADAHQLAAGSVLWAAALMVLAAGGLWARSGNLAPTSRRELREYRPGDSH